MAESIKKNFFYSSILTCANYIFPFITYPYISRVLGVENVGVCNFADSIVNYFLLISMMGISSVGVREIANTKGDKLSLNKAYSSLLILNTISSIIAIIALFIATICVPQLWHYKELMLVGGIRIAFSYLQIEWLFRGIEDFKYITIRSVIVRLFFIVSVFLFVRTSDDYLIYFILLTGMTVGNAVINLIYSRKFVKFTFNNISLKPFVFPFITIGFYMLLTSMYTTFNVAFLGFVAGEIEVGYYTTATKLYGILLSFFTAFTTVMLPRMSSFVGNNRLEDLRHATLQSVELLLVFTIPVIIISEVCTPQIIGIVSGAGYEGAILPMRVIMPLMLIIGYEQIEVVQILMPLQQDSTIMKNSLIAASVGIILNIILVPSLLGVGSAIVWIISEITVLILAQIRISSLIGINFPFIAFAKRLLVSVPAIILAYFINKFAQESFFSLLLVCIFTVVYCLYVETIVFKNAILLKNISLVKYRILNLLGNRNI